MSSPTLTQIYEQLSLAQQEAALAQQYTAQQAGAVSPLAPLTSLPLPSGYVSSGWSSSGTAAPTTVTYTTLSVGPSTIYTLPTASYIYFSGYGLAVPAEAEDEGWWA